MNRKINLFLFILLFFIIIGIALLVFINTGNIDIKNLSIGEIAQKIVSTGLQDVQPGSLIEIQYDRSTHPRFCIYKDRVVVCTNDSIKAYDKNGSLSWQKSISTVNPLIFTNGSNLLVADKGGRNIYVFYGNEIKWEQRLDGLIQNAHINRSGYVTVVHEKEGYKGCVKIYDSRGVELITRLVAENHILSSYLSPSSKYYLINSINTGDYHVTSKLEFIEMYANEPFAAIAGENDIISVIRYLEDDSFIAVSDNRVVYYSSKREKVFEFSMDAISGTGVLNDKYIVVSGSMEKSSTGLENSDSTIVIFEKNGRQKLEYPLKNKIYNIKTYSDIVAINTGREVFFIDVNGNAAGKFGSKTDIMDVHFFNKKEICVITEDKLYITAIGD
jgi:hypothetical protein